MTKSESIPPATVRIPCGIGVDGMREAEARYAIEALLVPLGLDAAWDSSGAPGPIGLWYAPAGVAPRPVPGVDSWIHVEAGTDGVPAPDDLTDPVALTFAWLSGAYERDRARDRFGRMTYEASSNHLHDLGFRAPVDEARDHLESRLRAAGVEVRRRRWGGRPWALCPTHDVDYVHKVRPGIVWRETAQYLLANRRRERAGARLRRFLRFVGQALPGRDPFVNAMARMRRETETRGGTATWFVKSGAHGPHDVGYRLSAMAGRLRQLVSAGHEVGLHPSFHAYAHPDRLAEETRRVTAVIGSNVLSVRTHYLRWHPSVTPRSAEMQGFRIDSTLGFGDAAGFRCGTCLPFRHWDPVGRQARDLWEMPLGLMESALFNRRGLDGDQALEETRRLFETCLRHGGVLVALWHNTLWDEDDYPGWGRHFVGTLDAAVEAGGAIRSLAGALADWRPETDPS